MKAEDVIQCTTFPCQDTLRQGYAVPAAEVDAARISIMLISECMPADPAQGYHAGAQALFAQTTLLAFKEAGLELAAIADLLDRGVYLTAAVKCAKRQAGIATPTILNCSRLLEQEIALFPNVQVFLLMGDVAIKALNAIARRNGEARVIPAGATYRLRGGDFRFRGVRVLPSYLQAGPAFFVERSKRQMIAEDIRTALRWTGQDAAASPAGG